MHRLLPYTSSTFCSSWTMKCHTTNFHHMRQHSRTCGWIEFHLLINLLDHPCHTFPRTWGPLIPFIHLFKGKCHRSSLYLYFQCCRETGMAAYFSDKLSNVWDSAPLLYVADRHQVPFPTVSRKKFPGSNIIQNMGFNQIIYLSVENWECKIFHPRFSLRLEIFFPLCWNLFGTRNSCKQSESSICYSIHRKSSK